MPGKSTIFFMMEAPPKSGAGGSVKNMQVKRSGAAGRLQSVLNDPTWRIKSAAPPSGSNQKIARVAVAFTKPKGGG